MDIAGDIDNPARKVHRVPREAAHKEVRLWMMRTNRTYRRLAKEVGVSRSYLVGIIHGYKRCSLEMALRLGALSGLKLSIFADLHRSSANNAEDAA